MAHFNANVTLGGYRASRSSALRVIRFVYRRLVGRNRQGGGSDIRRVRINAALPHPHPLLRLTPQNVAERFGQQAVQGIPDEALADALAEGFALPCFEFPRSPGLSRKPVVLLQDRR